MAYFRDLTPYTYLRHEKKTYNVGWLSFAHPFSTGGVPSNFFSSLEPFFLTPVYGGLRLMHLCEFCDHEARTNPELFLLEREYYEILRREKEIDQILRTNPTTTDLEQYRIISNRLSELLEELYPLWDERPDDSRSDGEIRVSAGDLVFAAPTMIRHYIMTHNYRPPDIFIAAVMGEPYQITKSERRQMNKWWQFWL